MQYKVLYKLINCELIVFYRNLASVVDYDGNI